MEKWEHCRLFSTKTGDLYIQYYREESSAERLGYTGTSRPNGPDELSGQIASLGQDGWEMVTVLNDTSPQVLESMMMFFKRRVESNPPD